MMIRGKASGLRTSNPTASYRRSSFLVIVELSMSTGRKINIVC